MPGSVLESVQLSASGSLLSSLLYAVMYSIQRTKSHAYDSNLVNN